MRINLSILLFFGVCCLYLTACQVQETPVQFSTAYPQRNQPFTIIYDPGQVGAKIPDTVSQIDIQFTYGNLYELPYVLPMERLGKLWKASFQLPRYATFATFIFKSGDFVDQPADTAQYELYIYEDKTPVENTYLYRAYSLPAQMGQHDSLVERQVEMYEKELEWYPENYEAKLRLLNNTIRRGDAQASAAAHAEAMALIDQKFHSNPTFSGNLNKVTMGYLIIGEDSRLDSVREVVIQEYPHSSLAKEYLASKLYDEPNPEKRKDMLLKSLEDRTPENASGYAQHYEMLLDYYIEKQNQQQAQLYADLVVQDTSPYKVQILTETADKLLNQGILAETALRYVQEAYAQAKDYPLGVIRYFPETGYIPSYVADKAEKIEAVRGRLKALEGWALDQLGRDEEAEKAMYVAAEKAKEKTSLLQVAKYFHAHQDPEEAFKVYKQLYLESPMDGEIKQQLKESYALLTGQTVSYERMLEQLDAQWKGEMKADLKKSMIAKALPEMKQLMDLKGNPITLKSFEGKVLVIDFWATWCVPCLASFPYMEKVYQKYKDREDVAFLIVNTGSNNTLEDAQKWTATAEYTFPIYYNADPEMLGDFGVRMIPASFLVDKSQQIRFTGSGFEGEIMEAKLVLMLDLLLEKD